jgi:phage tail protein X
MKRTVLILAVLAAFAFFGNTLGLSQQSGVTNIAGGRGGNEFSDPEPAAGTRVTEVRIRAGDTIDALQMVYAPASGPGFTADQHGKMGGRLNIFRLDPDEYIVGLAGRHGDTIDSLRIITNKKTSPTYGGGGGSRNFQMEVPGGTQAIGFIGRSGDTVDAIGLVYAPLPRRRSGYGDQGITGQYLQTQVFGGRGGRIFSDQDVPAGVRVAEIRISAGDTIDSLQMVYLLPNGRTVEGTRHGGSGGRLRVFPLEGDEYVIGLSGRSGDTIDSLRIVTNRKTSPTYGGSGGSRNFQVEVPNGNQAIGFAGRSGDTVDAIGLTYTALPVRRGGGGGGMYGGGQGSAGQYEQTQISGGRGGQPFSDQDIPAGARIAQIRISAGDTIDSLQMVYLLPDGRTVQGQRHGGSGGRLNIFQLDQGEYVIGIFGRFGATIDSLGIQTNRRASPIYGGGGGSRDFRVNVPSGTQAVGFAGRAGSTIDAIGLTYARMATRR